MRKLRLDILENAKDSLSHAVSHLIEKKLEIEDYKRVILDLAHAVELFLKERVNRIHPAFIWKNIDEYPLIDKNTIGTDQALKRLEKIGGVKLSDEICNSITQLRKIRNSIEHFKFEIDEKESNAIIGSILTFIFDFTENHLEINLISEFKNDDKWMPLLNLHNEFKENITQIMGERLKNKPTYFCAYCRNETGDIQLRECLLCGNKDGEIKCDICHQIVWESETQTGEIVGEYENGREFSYGIAVCNKCAGSSEPDEF